MRFLARVLSMICLVFAVIAGLVDAIQSVAAGQLVLTSLLASWSTNSSDTFAMLERLVVDNLPDWVWDPVLIWLLDQPAFAVFLGFSLLFYLLGYRRRRPAGRFAA
ncbi:hypothetical protein [Hoeflea olei]|uniref:Uncharacterized protein n=1 Tax=Hoeflea olei TaxID=1480615 RepID=A0A1C1YRK0_9HYPH|nr:hypothetical protein [Hoeflea olei]OCW55990.1 hypothetical protein AWJ14_12280 [Hoeflea olei]